MINYSCSYLVPPMRRLDIRHYTRELRKILGIQGPYFPIIVLLEILYPLIGVTYDVIDDKEWNIKYGKDSHAQYILGDRCIYIKESVFNGACNDQGRDRFTIAHEIGHALLLDDKTIKFCRSARKVDMELWKNPEWQADCFAGELLVPYDICKDMSVCDIVQKCKVSNDAASYQKRKFN